MVLSTPAPASSPLKRKHTLDDDVGPSTKKSKKERKHKHKHAQRGSEEFALVKVSLVVSVPPVFAFNPAQGVEEMLDSMIMRYIPPLRGVVLTHSNLQFLNSTATIQGDSPFATCSVGFDATIWSPRVGQRLTGTVNLCSPDHVSLLVHRTFNVSIPRHHIPQADWAFEYGPAENDPEYGVGSAAARETNYTAANEGGEYVGADVVMTDGQDDHATEPGGRWVHVVTGLPLGGDNAALEFTVIGLTIANQMLSLIGSIQSEPFSTEHIAPAQTGVQNVDPLATRQDEEVAEPERVVPDGKKHKRQKDAEGGEHRRTKKTEGKGHKEMTDHKESKREKKKKAAGVEEEQQR